MAIRFSLLCTLLALFTTNFAASQASSRECADLPGTGCDANGNREDVSNLLQSKAILETSAEEALATDVQDDHLNTLAIQLAQLQGISMTEAQAAVFGASGLWPFEDDEDSEDEEDSEYDKDSDEDSEELEDEEDEYEEELSEEVADKSDDKEAFTVPAISGGGYTSCKACEKAVKTTFRKEACQSCKMFAKGKARKLCRKAFMMTSKVQDEIKSSCADSCVSLRQTEVDEAQEEEDDDEEEELSEEVADKSDDKETSIVPAISGGGYTSCKACKKAVKETFRKEARQSCKMFSKGMARKLCRKAFMMTSKVQDEIKSSCADSCVSLQQTEVDKAQEEEEEDEEEELTEEVAVKSDDKETSIVPAISGGGYTSCKECKKAVKETFRKEARQSCKMFSKGMARKLCRKAFMMTSKVQDEIKSSCADSCVSLQQTEVDEKQEEEGMLSSALPAISGGGYTSCKACEKAVKTKFRKEACQSCKMFAKGKARKLCRKAFMMTSKVQDEIKSSCADSCVSLQQTEVEEKQEEKEMTSSSELDKKGEEKEHTSSSKLDEK